MKRSTLLAVLASATLIAGCGDVQNTSLSAKKIDQELKIEGCDISVHRVNTGVGDMLSNFTIAVAKCPTATTTSTQYGCGKGCTANNIVVQPHPPEARELTVPRDKAQQRKELREEINRLATRLDALEREF